MEIILLCSKSHMEKKNHTLYGKGVEEYIDIRLCAGTAQSV